jgi:predicted ATPase/DNA-binding SARP family transcriptional activator
MEGKITYHQQVSYCGKPRCRRCREGTGHGPYWYAYQTINGRTVRTYVGKNPPAEALQGAAAMEESSQGSGGRSAELASVVVRISVLGQFALERREDGASAISAASSPRWQPITDASLQHQRVRLLLICLISSPGRKIGREQAIEMLWPDLDFETASHRLDKAVHSLRQALEPGRSRPATSTLLLTEHATLQLADQSRVWIDADAFESLLSQARAGNDPGQTEQLLEEAALLYGGDYLPDERDLDWTQARRESLQRGWIGLLLELADLRIAREAMTSAIDTLDRLLAIDPTNEAAVQRLIVLLVQSGRRGEALRIYQRFAALLKQEYRIAPLPETRALYDTARRGEDTRLPHSPTSLTDNLLPAQEAARAGETEPRPYMQVGRSNQSQLVGREQEVAALQHMLHTTEQTRRLKLAGQKRSAAPLALDSRRAPQCALLMGDVGIGKTRLAEELGRDARRRGWTVTWTRAYAQETSIPYRMWTETLRKAMSQGLWQRQEIARHPLVYQALRALLPELEDLLPQAETVTASPEQEQLRLWEATRALLVTISESAPMLIVLDDLQWSDSSSCELLAYLVRQLRGHPILIAGTCRDIELPQGHPLRAVLNDLQREQAIETITVQPLTDDQIRALVSGHSGLSGLPDLPEPVVKHIQARAAGNPFFAEELARNVESGLASSDQSSGAISSGDAAPDMMNALPDTISAVLDLRLGRISSACQRLLVRGAVLGGAFEFNALLAMESGPTALDEDTILDLLEEGLQAGMLTEEGSGTRITYNFWHPLLVSHLYDGLSAGRRASLHRRAAEVLLSTYAGREEEEAAAIVYHLVNGGADSARVAHYAELAGDRAYALSAYPEAARHYRLAIDHTGDLPSNASADQHLSLANLLERLGECTRIQGKPEEARHYYEQALEIHEKHRLLLPPSDMSDEAAIEALLWVEIGKTWFNIRKYEQAQQCYTRAEKVLDEVGIKTSPVRAILQYERSYILWQEGIFEEATQVALQALKNFENVIEHQNDSDASIKHSTTIRRTLAGDPVDLGRTHFLLGSIAGVVGRNSDALQHLNIALAIFEQYERQHEIANLCCNLGDLYIRNTQFSLAQSALRRSINVGEQIGDIPILTTAYGNLGILSTRLGELAEAEKYFRKGLSLAEQVNDPVYISLLESYLTPVLQDQDKLEEARSTLLHALKISRTSKFAPCIGCSLIALGYLRINQVIQENHRDLTKSLPYSTVNQQLLRTRNSLERALALEGLEAETRTEGQLSRARTTFMLGEFKSARQQAEQVIAEARRLEQTWLLACAQRLLGSILSALKEFEAADALFDEATEMLKQHGMRLEEARTLYASGESQLQRQDAASHEKGLQRLQEARRIFEACHAASDLALVDHIRAGYAVSGAIV